MSAIVVIPAWRRPEMLAVTLDRIRKADGAAENFYFFMLDAGADQENWKIINKFPFLNEAEELVDKVGSGNSFNILEGLRWGLQFAEEVGANIIHLLEDDCWIGRDYFSSAEKIHKQFNPWALSLCKNQHRRYEPTQDPALVYACGDYQSIGVSFPLDSVREILVHNIPEYFEDMTGYLRMMFPNSRYGSLYPEQDGLIQRIIEKNNYDVYYINIPRAFHAGYYSPGYHREGASPTGTLQEKIVKLESMTEQEMNERSSFKDIRQIDLDKDWEVQEFYLE